MYGGALASVLVLGLPGRAGADQDAAEVGSAGAPATEEAPAQEGSLSFVYSGGLRGQGRGNPRFELHRRLADVAVQHIDPLLGVLAAGEHELWSEDGTVASSLAFIAGERTCDEGQVVASARTPTERLVASPGSTLPDVPDAASEPRRWQRCEAGGARVVVIGPPSGDARRVDWTAPTLRVGYRWRGAGELVQLARPRSEPARWVARLRWGVQAGAAFVDAGDFVDLGGPQLPTWRRRVDRSFAVLGSLKPVALALGNAELALGAAELATQAERHDLPYVATNWAGGPFPRSRIVTLDAGRPVRVAFLGLTDPEQGNKPVDVELLDPLAAAQQETDRLRASEQPPDFVVLLVHGTPLLQGRLRGYLHGVDLMLGDPSLPTYRVAEQVTALNRVGDAWKAAPVVGSLDGLAEARVRFDGAGPAAVSIAPIEVAAGDPADPAHAAALLPIHAAEQSGHEAPLVPPESPLAGVSRERWEQLLCLSVLEATDADAVFLDNLPRFRPSPGALTERQVLDRLVGDHEVEVHRVDGDRIYGFLREVHGVAPIQCGAGTGPNAGRIGGRPASPNRTYRVATTAGSRPGRLHELLRGAHSELVGDRPASKPMPGRPGLGDLVLERLRRGLPATERPAVTPLVLLDVQRLSFRVNRFQGNPSDAYQQVPETLLNSPSSFALGGDLDVALRASDHRARGDVRVLASYARFVVDGLPAQETADDWQISASLELPVAAFPPKASFQLLPFVQGSLDSEFTPAETDAGALPRQADLTAFAGLAASATGGLTQLRLGPFVNRDLGRLNDKGTEFGGRLLGSTWHSPLPQSALWLTSAWDVQVFADTPRDDAADLRLRLSGEGRASVRLWRALRFSVFVSALLVQGRVPETHTPSGSLTVGATLDLSAALRLDSYPTLFGVPEAKGAL